MDVSEEFRAQVARYGQNRPAVIVNDESVSFARLGISSISWPASSKGPE